MPHGRSQWAWTTRVGLSKASRMDMPPPLNGVPGRTYHRGRLRLGRAMAGAAVAVAFAYSFLRWKPFKVEIRGPSMAPTLVPGDWALAVTPGRLRRWDVVVVEHPSRPGFELGSPPGDRGVVDGRGQPGPVHRQPALRRGHLRSDQGQGPPDLLATFPAAFPVGSCRDSEPARRICSCNDPDTVPRARGGHDPLPVLLSEGARRRPVDGCATGTDSLSP